MKSRMLKRALEQKRGGKEYGKAMDKMEGSISEGYAKEGRWRRNRYEEIAEAETPKVVMIFCCYGLNPARFN